ncbi:MAG: hypothetical protein FWG20_00165 [Candidatus Cloacimonetes bacterium]|nr:hypothetical protein [Candidatus Cloacimonadota bacterium]
MSVELKEKYSDSEAFYLIKEGLEELATLREDSMPLINKDIICFLLAIMLQETDAEGRIAKDKSESSRSLFQIKHKTLGDAFKTTKGEDFFLERADAILEKYIKPETTTHVFQEPIDWEKIKDNKDAKTTIVHDMFLSKDFDLVAVMFARYLPLKHGTRVIPSAKIESEKAAWEEYVYCWGPNNKDYDIGKARWSPRWKRAVTTVDSLFSQ